MCQVRAITGCGSPSRVPFEFTTGWGELSIGGCPTWGRTVVCDVVVPVREFAPNASNRCSKISPGRMRSGTRGRTLSRKNLRVSALEQSPIVMT